MNSVMRFLKSGREYNLENPRYGSKFIGTLNRSKTMFHGVDGNGIPCSLPIIKFVGSDWRIVRAQRT